MSDKKIEKIKQYHHNSNMFGTGAIDKMQEEKIDELIERVNLLIDLTAIDSEPSPVETAEEWLRENYHEFIIHCNATGRKIRFFTDMLEKYASQRKEVTDNEIEKWANEHNVTHSLGDNDLIQEMFRKGCIRGAIQMRDGNIKSNYNVDKK
jgi:hypothetical protein